MDRLGAGGREIEENLNERDFNVLKCKIFQASCDQTIHSLQLFKSTKPLHIVQFLQTSLWRHFFFSISYKQRQLRLKMTLDD